MVVLDRLVRLVCMQFSCSNPDVIPSSVRCLDRETPDERNNRKSHSTGTPIIEPKENCSLVEFPGELKAAKYEMVDAIYQERIDANDPRGKRTYHTVRFLFARKEFVKISSKEFRKLRKTIDGELRSICEAAMWRVRAFSNPFYKDGAEIVGQCALSINLEARNPLFRPDGQPVTVWQKDQDGNHIGDAPLPLKPKHHLRIDGGILRLM